MSNGHIKIEGLNPAYTTFLTSQIRTRITAPDVSRAHPGESTAVTSIIDRLTGAGGFRDEDQARKDITLLVKALKGEKTKNKALNRVVGEIARGDGTKPAFLKDIATDIEACAGAMALDLTAVAVGAERSAG